MPRASASHILVKTEAQCNDLKKQIEGGADFGALAKQHSSARPPATAASSASSAPARWCRSSTRSSSPRPSARCRAP
jgi:peptidyl-prolyl cis-trans isomerase C